MNADNTSSSSTSTEPSQSSTNAAAAKENAMSSAQNLEVSMSQSTPQSTDKEVAVESAPVAAEAAVSPTVSSEKKEEKAKTTTVAQAASPDFKEEISYRPNYPRSVPDAMQFNGSIVANIASKNFSSDLAKRLVHEMKIASEYDAQLFELYCPLEDEAKAMEAQISAMDSGFEDFTIACLHFKVSLDKVIADAGLTLEKLKSRNLVVRAPAITSLMTRMHSEALGAPKEVVQLAHELHATAARVSKYLTDQATADVEAEGLRAKLEEAVNRANLTRRALIAEMKMLDLNDGTHWVAGIVPPLELKRVVKRVAVTGTPASPPAGKAPEGVKG